MNTYAKVILPLPLKGTFTYTVPPEMEGALTAGSRVAVQFGRHKIHTAIVASVTTGIREEGKFKPILELLDGKPVVTGDQLLFWQWLADYYLCSIGEVMAAALPAAFRLESETLVQLNPSFDGDVSGLDKSGLKVVEALMNRERMSMKEVSEVSGKAKVVNLIKTLIEQEIIEKVEEVSDPYRPRMQTVLQLHPDYHHEKTLSEVMDKLGKRAYRQLEVMMLIASVINVPEGDWNTLVPLSVVKNVNGYAGAVKSLVDKGYLLRSEVKSSRLETAEATQSVSDIELTEYQSGALEEIREYHREDKVCLLHGVTGSGKTEIYIKLIEECLQSGKQVLYLLPEIALTTQIIERLRKYFGEKVGVYHSRYSNAERLEVWKEVLEFDPANGSGKFNLILGARSSLLLPFRDLGLIIVDEEHDPSYKQFDPAPRYHARDSALYLARMQGARVLLGSATPSVESYALAEMGRFGLVKLTRRYTDVLMPEILVADIREERRKKTMTSHFSSLLLDHLTEALEQGEQAIMFQNRRGFSLRLECDTCQWMPYCRNCDVTLIYHKKSSQLRCHYCGYTEKVPNKCPDCGSPKIMMKGFGTEKVEEELADIYQEARIVRMDLDTTRSKTAYHRIINEFDRNQIQVLVGTQMVTKGLDFDNVSTVGILNADNMLSFPDFRATERSYQLMAQVSGRSGRKHKRGKVIIQTSQPYHSIIRQVIDNDFEAMFNDQLLERKQFHYPPYTRLIQLRVKHRDQRLTNEAAAWLAERIRGFLADRVLGPEFPIVARVRNEYIKHILIKVEREASVKEAKKVIRAAMHDLAIEPLYRRVKVQADVDPY